MADAGGRVDGDTEITEEEKTAPGRDREVARSG